MPVDRVLEAEQAIQDIATELGRMKSAADLIDSAQSKLETIIYASKVVIVKSGKFIKQGSQILERIGDYDIQGDLTKVIRTTQSIKEEVGNLPKEFGRIQESIDKTNNDLKGVGDSVENLVSENLPKEFGRIQEYVDEVNKSLKDIKDKNRQTGKIVIGLIGGWYVIGFLIILRIFHVI